MSKNTLLTYVDESGKTAKVLVDLTKVTTLLDNSEQLFNDMESVKTVVVNENGSTVPVKESFATVRKRKEES